MTGSIYMVINLLNGKRYVGKTTATIQERWNAHIYESKRNVSNSALHKAIKKYGADMFEVRILLKNIPADLLNRYEMLWICKMNSMAPQGYNLTKGGDGILGYHHTEEMRKHLSECNRGRTLNHGHLIRQGWDRNNTLQKRSENPLWHQHLSESRKGKYTGEDNGFYGKHHTAEVKEHLSKLRGVSVEMKTLQGESLQTFASAKSAGDFLMSQGITSNKYANSLILDACRGKVSYAYGFCWSFVNV